MSAKKAKRSAVAPPSPAPTPTAEAATHETAAVTPWIESTDPRKRQIARVALALVWLYVAALWLLVLDQTFGWGIFGPKVPATQ